MRRCLQLARNGMGKTYPNPLVGSVLVYDDQILGEGWHRRSGQPHAEVEAIGSVKELQLLPKSTLYVNLEPCNHHGKTPPCSDLIVKSGIRKVVVGSLDPNPKVAGAGIKTMEDAGIEVLTGILEEDCQQLNKRFMSYHLKRRPYVILKWAESPDGFIAPNEQLKGDPHWISNPFSRQQVHRLRAREQAILIGAQTLRTDDPGLNTRYWSGSNPLAIVWTKSGNIPENSKLWQTNSHTMLLVAQEQANKKLFGLTEIATHIHSVDDVLELLHQREIQSVIVEGGAQVISQFVQSGKWDEAIVFRGEKLLGSGVIAPTIEGSPKVVSKILGDECILYKPDR